ncbi:hypothetical protein Y032_0004g1719 [Ancylostoma ceylanicum]|uniref:Uncharacterized protein n=1 Tax=Ancylostoma ceylanicum TaxID=53326 RepID=A0A016VTF6_9BILA|nr:hypothetical protein Y032_0004g1719 [Ancylostoma ceylanicum]
MCKFSPIFLAFEDSFSVTAFLILATDSIDVGNIQFSDQFNVSHPTGENATSTSNPCLYISHCSAALHVLGILW